MSPWRPCNTECDTFSPYTYWKHCHSAHYYDIIKFNRRNTKLLFQGLLIENAPRQNVDQFAREQGTQSIAMPGTHTVLYELIFYIRASIPKLSVDVFFTIPLAKLGRIVGQTLWALMCLLIEVEHLEPLSLTYPDSKVHGANMGPIWGRQDPGGRHVGPWTLLSGIVYLWI